jgi:hypothetical protein
LSQRQTLPESRCKAAFFRPPFAAAPGARARTRLICKKYGWNAGKAGFTQDGLQP